MDSVAHKLYQKEYQAKWYAKNKARHKLTVRRNDPIRRRRNLELVDRHKVESGCKVCGYNAHPRALDLHHRDPTGKDDSVSSGICSRGWGIKRIFLELAKCDVMCANCHRISTFSE